MSDAPEKVDPPSAAAALVALLERIGGTAEFPVWEIAAARELRLEAEYDSVRGVYVVGVVKPDGAA